MVDHSEIVPYLQRRSAITHARRAQLIANIEAMSAEVRDIDILLRTLKEWEAQPLPLTEDDKIELTIRSAMKEALANLADFTNAEIRQAVKSKVPTAKDESIDSELSKAVGRGEATRLTTGNYRGTKIATPIPTAAIGVRLQPSTPVAPPGTPQAAQPQQAVTS